MTSTERLYALYTATRHVLRASVPGDLVECGVWKGGSAMVCAMLLAREADHDGPAAGPDPPAPRRLWLYDTFDGMTPPGPRDRTARGRLASEIQAERGYTESRQWCRAELGEVRANLASTGLADDRVRFIVGPVEATIPSEAPRRIALLRLDTDWYQSTYHELVHLYPRLSPGGVLIIDDYGCWRGARDAVDRYFAEHGPTPFLHRIDGTGRLVIKPHSGPPECAADPQPVVGRTIAAA